MSRSEVARDLFGWHPDQPALVAAHAGFVCRGDPAAVVAEIRSRGWTPAGRGDLDPWPVPAQIAWDADPFGDTNWCFQLQAWRLIDPFLLTFEQNADVGLAAFALEHVESWADFHLREGRTTRFSWYDMAVGVRAAKLAYLLDGCLRERWPSSPATVDTLLWLWHAHLVPLLDPGRLAPNNHGLLQAHGLQALIAALPESPLEPQATARVGEALRELLDVQFSPDGVHRENSPHYHFFATAQLARFLRTGWYERHGFARDVLEAATSVKPWLRFPDETLVTLGDSGAELDLARDERRLLAQEAKRHPAGTVVWKAFDTGYAVARTVAGTPKDRAGMLVLQAGFPTPVHRHADDLSVLWFERGRHVLVDSGKYGYHVDRWREYVRSTRAHNTVEIDETSFSTGAEATYESALQKVCDEPWGLVLIAEVAHEQLSVTHRREVLYRPGAWLLVVDRLVAAAPHTYTQWFHFDPSLSLQDDAAACWTSVAGERVSIATGSDAGDVRRGLERGEQSDRLQGWISRSYKHVEPAWALGSTIRAAGAVTLAAGFAFGASAALTWDPDTRALVFDAGHERVHVAAPASGAGTSDVSVELVAP